MPKLNPSTTDRQVLIMRNNKKPTRAEAQQEAEMWKDRAMILKEVVVSMLNYHNTRTAPVQFAQTKKFVEKCREVGVQLEVFVGTNPTIACVSTSIIAVDSDAAQEILDADLDAYGLLDFISKKMVQPWMKKIVDLDDLSGLEYKIDEEMNDEQS